MIFLCNMKKGCISAITRTESGNIYISSGEIRRCHIMEALECEYLSSGTAAASCLSAV